MTDASDQQPKEPNTSYQKLFIGGISAKLTSSRLESIFYSALDAKDCPHYKIVAVQCFTGYGFLILKDITEDDLDILISKINLSYNGYKLQVKKAIDRNQANINEVLNREKKVLVKNLTSDITETELFNYFSRIAPIVKCYVAFSPLTSEHRGFGFIIFENEKDAHKIINMKTHSLNGIEVTCCVNYTQDEVKNYKKILKEKQINKKFAKKMMSSANKSYFNETFCIQNNLNQINQNCVPPQQFPQKYNSQCPFNQNQQQMPINNGYNGNFINWTTPYGRGFQPQQANDMCYNQQSLIGNSQNIQGCLKTNVKTCPIKKTKETIAHETFDDNKTCSGSNYCPSKYKSCKTDDDSKKNDSVKIQKDTNEQTDLCVLEKDLAVDENIVGAGNIEKKQKKKKVRGMNTRKNKKKNQQIIDAQHEVIGQNYLQMNYYPNSQQQYQQPPQQYMSYTGHQDPSHQQMNCYNNNSGYNTNYQYQQHYPVPTANVQDQHYYQESSHYDMPQPQPQPQQNFQSNYKNIQNYGQYQHNSDYDNNYNVDQQNDLYYGDHINYQYQSSNLDYRGNLYNEDLRQEQDQGQQYSTYDSNIRYYSEQF